MDDWRSWKRTCLEQSAARLAHIEKAGGSNPSAGIFRGLAQLVARALWEREAVSSSLTSPTVTRQGLSVRVVAPRLCGDRQRGVRQSWRARVSWEDAAAGSNPASPTSARLAQSESAPDFGSGGWGFESLVERLIGW